MRLRGATSRAVFRAVADPTRRALLDRLREREQSVNDLRVRFRISQPAVSQHLGVLRRAGLVRVRRAGRQRMYQLNASPIREIYDWAASYRLFFDPGGHAWAFRRVEPGTEK